MLQYLCPAARGRHRHIPMTDTITNLKQLCKTLEQRSAGNVLKRKFIIEAGRKNYKVVAQDENSEGAVISRHAHCFVDKATGLVYKAASWSSAAKGVRYNLLDEGSFASALKNADQYGGYLYRRG